MNPNKRYNGKSVKTPICKKKKPGSGHQKFLWHPEPGNVFGQAKNKQGTPRQNALLTQDACM
jgi:hypothetical protein